MINITPEKKREEKEIEQANNARNNQNSSKKEEYWIKQSRNRLEIGRNTTVKNS